MKLRMHNTMPYRDDNISDLRVGVQAHQENFDLVSDCCILYLSFLGFHIILFVLSRIVKVIERGRRLRTSERAFLIILCKGLVKDFDCFGTRRTHG